MGEQPLSDADQDDVFEEARFRRAVEIGILAADQDVFATDEEINSAFARWGVKT